MVMPQTPYSSDLDEREPLGAMNETLQRLRTLAKWPPAQFEESYAPGKWTARQILMHLAQSEMVLGSRARLALATPNYVAQPFDQNKLMAQEPSLGGRDALDALLAFAVMNRAFFSSLTPADRAAGFSHPEYGALTVDWIVHMMAGHQIHHLEQLDTIASHAGKAIQGR